VPVLYLHPVGLDGAMWRDVAVPGALTPSFPGFGDTPLPEAPSFERLVEFVGEVLDGHGPADVVGVSLGSMVAQQVAVRRPDLVRSLVLACGGAATAAEAMLGRARATREEGMSGVLPSTLERWFTPAALAVEDHPGVGYVRARLLSDDPLVFAAYWAAMAEHDVTEELGKIAVPVTVVAGSEDVSVPVPVMREVADRIPGAAFHVVDGPHMLPLENPAGFAEAVERHLSKVARG
jgi:3-oxoadipate enol-lactonase